MSPVCLFLLLVATPSALQSAAPSADPIPRLSTELEQTRGLKFKRPVPSRHLSIEAALKVIAELVERDAPAAELAAQQRLLAALGLIPPTYDLRNGILSLLSDQVAGFYDPYAKQFVIVDFPENHPLKTMIAAAGDTILIHELDHALNDQHFDILAMLGVKERRDHDDELLARHALAEGDATLAMLLAQYRQAGVDPTPDSLALDAIVEQIAQSTTASSPVMQKAPEFVRAAIVEPYRLGVRYVGDAWKRGGWKAVDALWKNPPNSTEQLLHPEKSDDPPQRLGAEPPPPGFAHDATIQLGELGMRLLLQTRSATDVADRAAAGWDGDRVELFRSADGRQRIRLTAAWDSAVDAGEFAAAISAVCHCKPLAASPEHRLVVEWVP